VAIVARKSYEGENWQLDPEQLEELVEESKRGTTNVAESFRRYLEMRRVYDAGIRKDRRSTAASRTYSIAR
jgi:hypothetical protein